MRSHVLPPPPPPLLLPTAAPLRLCAPQAYPKGMPIEGLEVAGAMDGVTVYHSGTSLEAGVVKVKLTLASSSRRVRLTASAARKTHSNPAVRW